MMLDTWVVFLLGNALVVGGLYITYLLRQLQAHKMTVAALVGILDQVEIALAEEEEDADATRH
jgi:hypothetical protein